MIPVQFKIDVIYNSTTKNPSNFVTAPSAVVGDLQQITLSAFGEEQVIKITVNRYATDVAAKYWFMVREVQANRDITNTAFKFNFSVQASYLNLFGYEA